MRSSLPVAPRTSDDPESRTGAELADELDWDEIELIDGELDGLIAEGLEMAMSRLVQTNLIGAELTRLRATDVRFEACQLSAANFEEAILHRVAFTDCRLSGAVFSRARMEDVVFSGCKLDGASFRMSAGERVMFEASDLSSAELYEANLPGARFFDCDLTAADFSKARVPNSRLHGSTVERLKGSQHLKGAVVDSAQAMPLAMQLIDAIGIKVDDDREERPAR